MALIEYEKVKTHQQWFIKRKYMIYNKLTPYPWTRLGFTYDWGDDSSDNLLAEVAKKFWTSSYYKQYAGIPYPLSASI